VNDHPSPHRLPRSLAALPDESILGYLLRLSYRLRIAPLTLAQRLECTSSYPPPLARSLLLSEPSPIFAQASGLTQQETVALTLRTWAERYPPIGHALAADPRTAKPWVLLRSHRFCPACLPSPDTPDDHQAGTWKKTWHLPVVFACIQHAALLQDTCPHPAPIPIPRIPALIHSSDIHNLHPAQCRIRHALSHPSAPRRPPCGARLDQLPTLPTDPRTLDAQRLILNHLESEQGSKASRRFFTDLRITCVLLRAGWPGNYDLLGPDLEAVFNDSDPAPRISYSSLDTPAQAPATAAALLTTAVEAMNNPGMISALAARARAAGNHRGPTAQPWTKIFKRHEADTSPKLQRAIKPHTYAFKRTPTGHLAHR
jgi:hypothetical protein